MILMACTELRSIDLESPPRTSMRGHVVSALMSRCLAVPALTSLRLFHCDALYIISELISYSNHSLQTLFIPFPSDLTLSDCQRLCETFPALNSIKFQLSNRVTRRVFSISPDTAEKRHLSLLADRLIDPSSPGLRSSIKIESSHSRCGLRFYLNIFVRKVRNTMH
jgi:hypothetical protein